MFTMLVSIMTYFIFLFVWAVTEAIICLYIFRDSRKYKMNTPLWMIIGLVFSFPGLCAYFVVRKRTFLKKCPVCLCETSENSTFCSNCGINLNDARPKLTLLPKIFIGICTTVIIWQAIKLIFISLYSL